MMNLLSEYTGGNGGWGTIIYKCASCGEIVAEYTTHDDGRPADCIFDDSETHECDEDGGAG